MATKKSPAELKAEGAAVSEQIALARKKTLNFALLMAKDGLILETDMRKDSEILWRNAKKTGGGGSKGAKGTMQVNGKVIEFTCTDDSAPGQLPKLFKKFLSERGQAYQVVMVTPSGALGDSDGAGDGPDQGDDPEGVSDNAADPLAEELRSSYEGVSGQVELAKQSLHAGAAKKASQLSEIFETQLTEEPRKAAATFKLLQKTVADAIAFGVRESAADSNAHNAGPEMPGVSADAIVDPNRERRIEDLQSLRQRVEDLLGELA